MLPHDIEQLSLQELFDLLVVHSQALSDELNHHKIEPKILHGKHKEIQRIHSIIARKKIEEPSDPIFTPPPYTCGTSNTTINC